MKQEHIKWLWRGYKLLLSLAAAAAAVCLMVACWQVYASGGEQLYTPEKVAEAFAGIALPVWLFAALAAGSLLLGAVLPQEQKKAPREKNRMLILQRLRDNADLTQAPAELLGNIRKEQSRRNLLVRICVGLLALGTVAVGVYALQTTEFDHVKTFAAAARPMALMLAFLAVPLALSIFTAYTYRKSVDREIDLWKQVGAGTGSVRVPRQTGHLVRLLPYGIVVLAVGLMIFGYLAGGWQDVLTKAVNICTECVGLG